MAALALAGPGLAQDYRLGAGDVVSIKVYDEPRLSRETLVPSSCAVDVELIGAVEVCGRTTVEIAAEVERRFADGFLVDPHVIVEVRTFGSQRIEVRGAVKKPGIQVLTGPTTLSQAITLGGGPEGDNVVEVDLVRADGGVATFTISKLNLGEPVLVEAGDTVVLKQGRHVYVDGEVEKEGQVPYTEGLTVLQAVTLAGGPGTYASLRRVFVLSKDGQRKVVNLQAIREGRAEDVVLQPDDRITLRRAYL